MKKNKLNYLSPAITVFRSNENDVISTSNITHDSEDNYVTDPFGN